MNISSLLPSLDKFKVIPQDTLFPIDCRDVYKKGCCPKCGFKIYLNRAGTLFFCKSKKCTGFAMKKK